MDNYEDNNKENIITEDISQQPREDTTTAENTNNIKSHHRVIFIGVVITLGILAMVAFLTLRTEPQANVTLDQPQTPLYSYLEAPEEESNSGRVIMYSEELEEYVYVDSNSSKSIRKNIIFTNPDPNNSNDIIYEDIRDEFEKDLISKGLEKLVDISPELELDLTLRGATRFQSDELICDLQVVESGYFGGSEEGLTSYVGEDGTGGEYPGYVLQECADVDDLSVVVSFVAPFYEAYKASSDYIEYIAEYDDYSFILGINETDVVKSSIDGYEYVQGGIATLGEGGGASVSFARSESMEWEFVLAQQDMAGCENYATVVARRAFADASCYSKEEDGAVTLKEYYNL